MPSARDRSVETVTEPGTGAPGVLVAVGEAEIAPLIRTIESEIIPRMLLAHKGAACLAEETGVLGELTTGEHIAEFAGLPLVVGPGAPQHCAALIEVLNKFPVVQRRVKASVRVGDRRWDLHLKNGMQVRLPEDGVEDALARLTALEQEQKIFDRDIESVDLRLPDRLVVKPRGGAAEQVQRGEAT